MASQSPHKDNETAIDKMNQMLEGALDEQRRNGGRGELVMPAMDASEQGAAASAGRAPRGLAQRVTSRYFADQEAMQQQSEGMEL